MAYRHLENIDEKIIEVTVDYGSRMDTAMPSTKAIAKKIGISEFVIYDHFSSKKKLIAATEKAVIAKVYEVQKKLISQQIDFKSFWYKMVDYYILNPTMAGWSINYGHIFPRPDEPMDSKESQKAIMEMGKEALITLGFHFENDNAYLYAWMWVYRSIISYAGLVIYSGFADCPATRESSFSLCFNGLGANKRVAE